MDGSVVVSPEQKEVCEPRPGVVAQDAVIDMDDNLVAVAGRPAVEVRGQGALGQQPERVGAPLTSRDLGLVLRLVIELVGRRFERTLHDRSDLG